MLTSIKKWGNSQGILLPKAILDSVAMACGTEVEILIEDQDLIIRAVAPHKEHFDLDDLFKDYKGPYKPKEEPWGPARGGETW